jgi:hypothetical protein
VGGRREGGRDKSVGHAMLHMLATKRGQRSKEEGLGFRILNNGY